MQKLPQTGRTLLDMNPILYSNKEKIAKQEKTAFFRSRSERENIAVSYPSVKERITSVSLIIAGRSHKFFPSLTIERMSFLSTIKEVKLFRFFHLPWQEQANFFPSEAAFHS